MKRKILIALTVIIIISSLVVVNVGESERLLVEKKVGDVNLRKDKILNYYEYELKKKNEMERVAEVYKQQKAEKQQENKIDESKRPTLTVKIPLSDELLDYIFQQSEKYEIPYTLVLAVMKVESEFRSSQISSTKDYGLMQVSSRNIKWLSDELRIKDSKPLDEKQNIQMGIYYMKHIKDYWSGQGIPDEQMFTLVVMGYHYGIEGSKRWIKQHGWNSGYVNKVLEFKSELERGMTQ